MQEYSYVPKGTIAKVRPVDGIQFDWLVMLASIWYVGGLFLDGWAHNHGKVDQSFFTPWHAVLYSGYAVTAAVILGAVVRNHLAGYTGRMAIPAGYELSLLGIAIFAVGGVGDLIWHTLFGIEMDIAALLSPTHLILALGLALIVTGPLRAAWRRTDVPRSWAYQLPMILSLTSLLSLFTFFTQYANPIVHSIADKQGPAELQWLGIVSILFQTAILTSLVLLVVRRWRLPLGAFALIFAVNDASSSILADNSPVLYVAILGAVTGLIVDLLYSGLKYTADQPGQFRLFAFAVPVIAYSIYFVALLVLQTIAWSIHLWAGSIVLAGIIGWLISYLFVPPSIPDQLSIS